MKNIIINRSAQTVFLLIVFSNISFSQVNCDTIIPPPDQSNYILPYPIGKTYCITQGNCPTIGGHSNLFAYDFNTQIGDTIVASRPGTVVFINEQYSDSDWVNGHENNVFIQHSDGSRIRYTHLKQFGVMVEAGNIVQAGQPIALSGNSGNTGGNPHLHLQAFRNGSSYNGFNSVPINFSNTTGPVNSQNLCIQGGCYNALDPTVSVNFNNSINPDGFSLEQNYPNPFNPATKIVYTIPVNVFVDLKIYNISGMEIQTLVSEDQNGGYYEIDFNAEDLPGGIYFYRIQTKEFTQTRKLVLIK